MTVAARVIPCLDVAAGRVVKGVNFQNLRDMGDPVELATHYAKQGADEITFLDVTATVDERATTYDVVQRTAEQVFVPLTVVVLGVWLLVSVAVYFPLVLSIVKPTVSSATL